MPTLPFDRSYWVIPGKLLAGFFPGSRIADQEQRNMAGLIASGVRTVINLMHEYETDHSIKLFKPYEAALRAAAAAIGEDACCIRIPIRDMSIPSRDTMRKILDSIDESMAERRPVYVHCWGGKGRTGTVVGCYFVRHGFSGEEALQRVQELRQLDPTAHQPSPETFEQRNMVLIWS
jgi:predicted protein tyrosine phosphatase